MKALIIEDESVAASALKSLIEQNFPDITIEAVLQSVDESVEWLSENPSPDLAFMDIHLADGSSFGIFEEVNIRFPVIFTTAYDEYALKAFHVNSIDYLLKPISLTDLERAVNKFKNLSMHNNEGEELRKILSELNLRGAKHKTSFLVAVKDKLIPLAASDIAYIFIENKIVTAVTFENEKRRMDQTLDELAEMLDPVRFYRANRQYILSRPAIKDLSVWFGGKLAVNLTVPTSEKIFISKARVREFKNWIAGAAYQ